jgi:hypothetical protein
VKEKIEAIVRNVVLEYFKRENNKLLVRDRKIFVFLEENNSFSKKKMWETISEISKSNTIVICLAESNLQVPLEMKQNVTFSLDSKEELDLVNSHLKEAEIVFIPSPTFSTLAKLALTINDSTALNLLVEAQFSGKQLLLANDSIILKGDQKITTPHSIQKKIQSYLKQLREDEVQLVPLKNVAKWLDSYFESDTKKRPIVLAKHIDEISKEGLQELQVPKNSLVTPMSKEYAKDLGISIKYKE